MHTVICALRFARLKAGKGGNDDDHHQ